MEGEDLGHQADLGPGDLGSDSTNTNQVKRSNGLVSCSREFDIASRIGREAIREGDNSSIYYHIGHSIRLGCCALLCMSVFISLPDSVTSPVSQIHTQFSNPHDRNLCSDLFAKFSGDFCNCILSVFLRLSLLLFSLCFVSL